MNQVLFISRHVSGCFFSHNQLKLYESKKKYYGKIVTIDLLNLSDLDFSNSMSKLKNIYFQLKEGIVRAQIINFKCTDHSQHLSSVTNIQLAARWTSLLFLRVTV